jgi:hypothetical protein
LGQGAVSLLVFGLFLRSLKIAFPAFVRLRRLSVALLQNLPKTRAKSGRVRLPYAPRAFFQIFIKATLNRRFAGLVWGHLMQRGPRFQLPLQT